MDDVSLEKLFKDVFLNAAAKLISDKANEHCSSVTHFTVKLYISFGELG